MSHLDRAIRDCRRWAEKEPENLHLQQQVDHLNQVFPEGQPWTYERSRLAGFWGYVLAFLLAGAVFCCGLHYHRTAKAGGWSEPQHPAQQVAIQPAPEPDRMSWVEGLTAIGVFLGGAGGLAAWRRNRRRD